MEQNEVRIPSHEELKQLKRDAEQGDAEAQYQLGCCYANGLGVEIDMVEAVRWFALAAEQGVALAQHALGNCYYYGYGVDYDCTKAVSWHLKAAKQGLAKAQCSLGKVECFNDELDRDYKQRDYYWFRLAADQGDAEGQWRLSQCCIYGSKEEIYWCTKAAEQGYKEAVDYMEARRVEQKAMEQCLKAASQGDVEAMVMMGEHYEEGDVVEMDCLQAIRWYRLAAEHGDNDAVWKAKELEESIDQIMVWKHAAEQGNAEAMYHLADSYDWGWHIKCDLEKAAYWYTLAAEHGESRAERSMERLKYLMIDEH